MMNLLKHSLLLLGLILCLQVQAQDNILVPRKVGEFCLECVTKLTYYEELVTKKDSTNTDLRKVIKNDSLQFITYKSDSVKFEKRISNLETINTNNGKETELVKGELKRIKKQRNGERVGGGLLIIVLVGLLFL